MKSILLLLTILLVLNAGAQRNIPLVNNGKLAVLIDDGSPSGYLNYITSCWDYRVFKKLFPDFVMDKKIESKYNGCQIIKKREDILIPNELEQETNYRLWKEFKMPVAKRPSWMRDATKNDLIELSYTPPCAHIYVAVMDSVAVRDSTVSNWSWGSDGLTITLTKNINDPYSLPSQKIVCLLCHRVTNQVIKYEPQAARMPCGGCGITLDTLKNHYVEYSRPSIVQTVKILLTDKN